MSNSPRAALPVSYLFWPLFLMQLSCSSTGAANREADIPPAAQSRAPSTEILPPKGQSGAPNQIGLWIADSTPKLDYLPNPTSYAGDSAAMGALKGAGGGVGACLDAARGGREIAALFIILCAPVGLVAGATVGAVRANKNSPEDPSKALRKKLKLHVARAREDLLIAIEKYATDNNIAIEKLQKRPSASYESVKNNAHGSSEIPLGKALEVEISRILVVPHGVNTSEEELGVEVHVRVVTLTDHRVIDTYSFIRSPLNDVLGYWDNRGASVDNTVVDKEFSRAYEAVAQAVLDESVLIYRGGTGDGASANAPEDSSPKEQSAPSPFPDYTLQPILPSLAPGETTTGTNSSSPGVLPGETDNLSPTFHWRPLSLNFGSASGLPSQIRDVTYEFRLYAARDLPANYSLGEKGFYVRSGLLEPMHTLEIQLSPWSDYYWTVRAHFTLGGQPKVTEWSGAYNSKGQSFDPAWYRRNSFPNKIASSPMMTFYPQFRATATVTPNQASPSFLNKQIGLAEDSVFGKAPSPEASVKVPSVTGPAGQTAPVPSVSRNEPVSVAPTVTATPAPSAESDQFLKVGDRWKYKFNDRGRDAGSVTVEIIKSSDGKVRERFTREGYKGFVAERDVEVVPSPSRFLAPITLPGGYLLTEITPYLPPGTELKAGQFWNSVPGVFFFSNMGKKMMVLQVRVVRQEDVRVPAATFASWRIEAESEEDHSGIYPVKVSCTFWYSAEMKRTIKMTIDAKVLGGSGGETYELASFASGK